LRQGEPHCGERPDGSPGWTVSGAGQRSVAVATDGVREANQSHAFDSPVPAEHRGEPQVGERRHRKCRLVRSETMDGEAFAV